MPIDRTSIRLRALNRRRVRLGPDLCDLIRLGTASDGANGHKPAEIPLAADVSCFVEELSAGSAQVVSGGVTVVATHRITMEATDEALSLSRHDKIRVQPRGSKGALVFEQPIISEGSFTPLAVFRAILAHGYRAPAGA